MRVGRDAMSHERAAILEDAVEGVDSDDKAEYEVCNEGQKVDLDEKELASGGADQTAG